MHGSKITQSLLPDQWTYDNSNTNLDNSIVDAFSNANPSARDQKCLAAVSPTRVSNIYHSFAFSGMSRGFFIRSYDFYLMSAMIQARVISRANGPDKGPELAAIAIVCLTLAWLGTLLRFYVRYIIVNKVASDDWCFAACLGMFTIFCSFVLSGVHYGTGQHISELTPSNAEKAMRFWYCCEWSFALTTTLIKVAFGVFYLRLVQQRWQRRVLWSLIVICASFGLVYFFCIIFQCAPVSYMWTRYNGGKGKCLLEAFILWGSYSHSILSAIVDWIFAILPVYLVWGVQMNTRTKIAVIVVLAFGAIASAATIIRLAYLWRITRISDFLWQTFDIAVWATVECGVGLFCGGLAVCRPLLRVLVGHIKEDIKPRIMKATPDATFLISRSPKPASSHTEDAAMTSTTTYRKSMELRSLQSRVANSAGHSTTMIWCEQSAPDAASDESGITKSTTWQIEEEEEDQDQGSSSSRKHSVSSTPTYVTTDPVPCSPLDYRKSYGLEPV